MISSINARSFGTNEEIEYNSNHCEEFAFAILTTLDKPRNNNWVTHTISRMVHNHPHKLTSIPLLHKCAIFADNLRVNDGLFAFFAGHYISHEYDYKKFISYLADPQHVNAVKTLKDIEYLWDIFDSEGINKLDMHKIMSIVYPLKHCKDPFCAIVKYSQEINKSDIKIMFHDRYIDIFEYNMFRLMHVSDEECEKITDLDLNGLLKQMKDNGKDIYELVVEMEPIFDVSHNIIVRIDKMINQL